MSVVKNNTFLGVKSHDVFKQNLYWRLNAILQGCLNRSGIITWWVQRDKTAAVNGVTLTSQRAQCLCLVFVSGVGAPHQCLLLKGSVVSDRCSTRGPYRGLYWRCHFKAPSEERRSVDHQCLTSHEVGLSASTPHWYVNRLQALNCLLIYPYLFVCIFHIAYFSSFWVSDNIQSRYTFFFSFRPGKGCWLKLRFFFSSPKTTLKVVHIFSVLILCIITVWVCGLSGRVSDVKESWFSLPLLTLRHS